MLHVLCMFVCCEACVLCFSVLWAGSVFVVIRGLFMIAVCYIIEAIIAVEALRYEA